MAVDQDRQPESRPRALDQAAQTLVVGPMQCGDSRQGVGDGDSSLVDRLRIADDARNRAQARRDAQRAGIGEFGQRPVEHLRIELERLAVGVEKGAREMRAQQWRAERDAGQEQFVDESVLGAAQRQRVQPRGVEKALGIARARMGRIEDQRRGENARLDDVERRLKLRFARPPRLVHRVLLSHAGRRTDARHFIIIAFAPYLATPTAIKSPRLHSIFTRWGR